MNIAIDREKFIGGMIAALMLISGMAIFKDDTTLVSESIKHILSYIPRTITILLFLLVAIEDYKLKLNLFCILPLIWWVVIHLNSTYDSAGLFFIGTCALIVFCLADDYQAYYAMKCFRYIMIIISCISIICYLSFFLHIPIPYRIVDFYSSTYGRHYGTYIDYGISYIWANIEGGYRSCGLFNEPGFYGTFLAFTLILDNYDLRKNTNIILIIAAVTTFSMAFFLITLVWLLLVTVDKPRIFVAIMIVFILYFFVIPNINFSNPYIRLFVDRFYSQEGTFFDTTRRTTRGFDQYFDAWKNSDKLLFGYGYNYNSYVQSIINNGTASYKHYLIDYGIVGTLILLVPLLVLSLYKADKNRDAVVFVICSFVSLYQRPYAYATIYFGFLLSGIAYIRLKSKYEKDTNDGIVYRAIDK